MVKQILNKYFSTSKYFEALVKFDFYSSCLKDFVSKQAEE